jgi:DNA helicase II / ATP-dependent DNA helicase PcrA
MDFIKKVTGPCIILAGAGTGKTTSIAEKIKYLVSEGIYSPEKIVCITFSNEASNNLYSKVRPFISGEKEPVIKTFHSFSAEILRIYGKKIGIEEDFKILTPDDAKVIMHKNFNTAPKKCHDYIGAIGIAKDVGISFEQVERVLSVKSASFSESELRNVKETIYNLSLELSTLSKSVKNEELKKKISELKEIGEMADFLKSWRAYERIKKLNNYQDYSDLNQRALELLKLFPEIAKEYEYVIVDEFQDTNRIQLDFLVRLAFHKNITIVGDLNQSIYMFRGAYTENFSVFREKFGVLKEDVFNLDKSHRSTNRILSLANKLISNNHSGKNLFDVTNARGIEGEKISVYEMKNGFEEARKVCEIIEEERKEGIEYSDICVIFRTHQQGRVIKRVFEERGIPFVSASKKSLFEQGIIKRVISYLKIISNVKESKKRGEDAWWDLFFETGFEKEDLIKIGREMNNIKNEDNFNKIALEKFSQLNLSYSGEMKLKAIGEKINMLVEISEKGIAEIIKEIFVLEKSDFEIGKQEMLDFNKFYNLAVQNLKIHFGEIANFVHYLEIIESLGINIESSESEENGVRLMTAHSTKGLEYHTVILTNMAEKRFPIEGSKANKILPLELFNPELVLSGGRAEDIQKELQLLEERRLCYVSFTRAKSKLFITYSREYSKTSSFPSRFLGEIDYKNCADIEFYVDSDEKYIRQEEAVRTNHKLVFFSSDVGEAIAKLDISVKSPYDMEFSPSSILLFKECQKKFEYKYIYNMPEKKPVFWEDIRIGSFVHLVLEKGVRGGFQKEEEFINLAREFCREQDWEGIDIDASVFLIRVFFARNKGKYNSKSRTEQILKTTIGELRFTGFADRIDFNSEGVDIVDYKTGRAEIVPEKRNIQMGYYAIAAQKFGRVNRVILDTLRREKPVEFILKGSDVVSVNSKSSFNLEDVRKELYSSGQEIMRAIKDGFKECSSEKNCAFCTKLIKIKNKKI